MTIEYGTIYQGDFQDVLVALGSGWAHLICTGPSAYGQGQEQLTRHTRWATRFKEALRPDGVLYSVWPEVRVWGFTLAAVHARYRTMQVHWNMHEGVTIAHAGQCALIATPGMPEALPVYDGEFATITPAVWSSGFPVELAERAIETYCPPDGVVFDPFMGMGTTAVAAIRTGRRWVGCEQDRVRVGQAYERIKRETGWERPDAVH